MTHLLRKSLVGLAVFTALAVVLLVPASAHEEQFEQGIVLGIDDAFYYLDGPPLGPNGEKDVPGHYWMPVGKNQLLGLHFNSGPVGPEGPVASWWSSDAPDGALLYFVIGTIDTWSPAKARRYARSGYVHYHELISVDAEEHHPTKVIWLKHIAVSDFTLDGGPGGPNPPYEHLVSPGIDYSFTNTWQTPYSP